MPIYEYVCRGCGHELEKLQKIADAPLTSCPQCGETKLQRKISAVGFRLKGSGWYETDFKGGNKRNLAGDSTPATAEKPVADKPAAPAATTETSSASSSH